MSNLWAIWNKLSTVQKASLAAVLAVTLAGFAVLINVASKPSMAFLYGGLDPAAAGDVLTALEAMDVLTEVRGDAIYVPNTRRDSVRMALARQGLPQQGQPGFELLDEMNGFATTSEMFDAAYWRAKEGELARTIVTIPGVKAARVHLAVPTSSAFARSRGAPSASATVTMSRGRLDTLHATSIRYLIALAVPNLDPEQVAIMDSVHGLILKPDSQNPELPSEGDEPDRIRRLEQSLIDLIEARVGPGNARVTVSLTIDRERESVSERILDPNSRVIMSRETSDIQQTDVGGTSAVTVASNLPDGEANDGATPSRASRNETTETSRFEISEIHRQREKLPGAVARINVAVLVNEQAHPDAGAALDTGRTPKELDAIRDLVAAAIGYEEARGDVVTVRAMPFYEVEPETDLIENGGALTYIQENLIAILQVVIPALVVIVLAFFVIRPVLMQDAGSNDGSAQAANVVLPQAPIDVAPKSPVEELRDLAAERREESTKVLKSWLGETENAA